jgi:hypothetical protein
VVLVEGLVVAEGDKVKGEATNPAQVQEATASVLSAAIGSLTGQVNDVWTSPAPNVEQK